jgi:mono/diheme cytochrome c family protein
MITNLLILLIVTGLAVFFGWLTYRAVRAQRLWVKIAGGLGAGLLTLIFAAVAFFGGKGQADFYIPAAPAAPDLKVAGTPEQIARGDYLVNVSCSGCHSAVDANGMPTGQHPLSGGFNLPAAEGFGFIGDMIAENLTPGGKLAGYSDGELFRALRYSVNQEGHTLAMMSFMPYRDLGNEDMEAVIAYLRSLPAAENRGQTGDNLNFIGAVMSGAGMFGPPAAPAPATITAPAKGATSEYGKYVATFGECRGCHGPDLTGSEATAVSEAVPNPRPFVGELSLEQFVEMMRTGVKPDGQTFPPSMPWQNASKMTDDDLAALYAYLTAPLK